jgi:hypothetical protein
MRRPRCSIAVGRRQPSGETPGGPSSPLLCFFRRKKKAPCLSVFLQEHDRWARLGDGSHTSVK